MKNQILPFAIAMALSITLVNCGGEEKKEEPENTDTVEVAKDTTPVYEYTYKIDEVEVAPRWAITVGDSTNVNNLSAFFMKHMPTVGKLGGMKPADMTEAPIGLYYGFSTDKNFYTKVAVVVKDSTLKVKAPGKLEKLPSGKAIKIVYMGDYENMTKAYEDLGAYMTEKGLMPAGPSWEQYVTDPGTEKDTTKWETDIYFPVAPVPGK